MPAERGARSLPKEIWTFGWISFFADICSEMAYPVLALFMAAIGQGPAALGIVEGVAESVVSFMKAASGVRSDVTGRRVPYVVGGYGLSALGKPLIALARSWPLVMFARSLDRFGKGIRTTARDTLIVEYAGKQRLGAAFGLQRALDTAGAFVGVVFTLLLLYIFHGPDQVAVYRAIFLVAFIPGVIAVLFTLRLREPAREADADESAPADGKARARIRLKAMPQGYWKAIAITSVFALANSSDTFLILRANQVFKTPYGIANAAILAIWAYALYNVVYTFVSYPAGELSDRVGRWAILGVGWLIYAAVYAGMAFTNALGLWLLFGFYGVYIGMTDGVSKALVGDFVPKHAKGTAMGLFYMISGFATLAASGVMGLVWNAYGYRDAFLLEACLAVVAVVLVAVAALTSRTSNHAIK